MFAEAAARKLCDCRSPSATSAELEGTRRQPFECSSRAQRRGGLEGGGGDDDGDDGKHLEVAALGFSLVRSRDFTRTQPGSAIGKRKAQAVASKLVSLLAG